MEQGNQNYACKNILLLKVGGSSITEKAKLETLDEEALKWFARSISLSVHDTFLSTRSSKNNLNGPCCNDDKPSIIVVHGAGSFGHHTAKKYGLRGRNSSPPKDMQLAEFEQRELITGLAKTRHSVKKLNSAVVSHLIEEGVNAVGISPCLNIPGLMAHGGNEYNGVTSLVQSIRETLSAGLMPVIHGDAGLYGTYQRDGENDSDNFKNVSMSAGILGGDTLVDIIATHPLMDECISKTIFLTDVEGVFTKDPKTCKDAVLVRSINIDPVSGEVMTEVSASASLHEHDVTGGLEAKLGAAANVAKSGIEVVIAECCSSSAEIAMGGITKDTKMCKGTIIRRYQN